MNKDMAEKVVSTLKDLIETLIEVDQTCAIEELVTGKASLYSSFKKQQLSALLRLMIMAIRSMLVNTGMTEERSLKVLGLDKLSFDGARFNDTISCRGFSFRGFEGKYINIGGSSMTVDELEAVAWWMRNVKRQPEEKA